MCHGFGGIFGWWGMGLGFGGHLVVTILIIMAAVWLFKKVSRADVRKQSSGALEILKQRYARGEITSADYQQMKKELE